MQEGDNDDDYDYFHQELLDRLHTLNICLPADPTANKFADEDFDNAASGDFHTSGIIAAASSAAAAYNNDDKDGTFANALDNCNGSIPLSLLTFMQSAATTLDNSLTDFMLLADQPQVTSTPICMHNNNTQQISYFDNSHAYIDFDYINTFPTWKDCNNKKTTYLVPFQQSSNQTVDVIFADFMLQADHARFFSKPICLYSTITTDGSIIDWDLYDSFSMTLSNHRQYIAHCTHSFTDHLAAYDHFHPTFMIPSLLPPPEPPPTTSRFIFLAFQLKLGICFWYYSITLRGSMTDSQFSFLLAFSFSTPNKYLRHIMSTYCW